MDSMYEEAAVHAQYGLKETSSRPDTRCFGACARFVWVDWFDQVGRVPSFFIFRPFVVFHHIWPA